MKVDNAQKVSTHSNYKQAGTVSNKLCVRFFFSPSENSFIKRLKLSSGLLPSISINAVLQQTLGKALFTHLGSIVLKEMMPKDDLR